MIKILVAEDDKDLNKLVCSYLTASGYAPTACYDGAQAIEEFENGEYSLVLSDVMMPHADGFTLAERVRENDKRVPVIFMTALSDKPSKQLGFKLGVDDYLVKPFDLDELIMRVAAVLRRAGIEESREINIGNFRMNKDEHTAYIDGEELSLTVREFDLLFKFLSYPKKTFTRSQLMAEFWDFDSSATSRTVDVYMAKLREKTSRCTGFEIVTVHGLGYKAVLK
ncbi:MAG: response regulator transcription factor [Clostridia bacterium]|nr:response regulator transcription factor [Clostridia bacterium]